jgi:phosphocarrier protein HPr
VGHIAERDKPLDAAPHPHGNSMTRQFMEPSTRTVMITNRHGLHARPSVIIVKTVRKYDARVTVRRGNQTVDASSVLDLLSFGAEKGTELVLAASGPQAEEVLDALVHLFDIEFEVDYKD